MPDRTINQHPLNLTPNTGGFILYEESGVTYKVYADSIANFTETPANVVLQSQTGMFVTQNDARGIYLPRFFSNVLFVTGASAGFGMSGTSVLTGSSTVIGNIYNTGTGFFNQLVVGKTGTHLVSSEYAGVLGGERNFASGQYAYVGNGIANTGIFYAATILNGEGNFSSGQHNTIINGQGNIISGATYASIVNGYQCKIISLPGGNFQTASTIGGGLSNIIYYDTAFIGGGSSNILSGYTSIIGAGYINYLSGQYSCILGGNAGRLVGDYSTVLGGNQCFSSGNYSLTFGNRAKTKVNHNGAVVLADSTDADRLSFDADSFNLYYANGYFFSGDGSIFNQNHLKTFGTGTFVSGLVVPYGNSQSNNTVGSLFFDSGRKILSVGADQTRVNLITTGNNMGTGFGIFSGTSGAMMHFYTLVGGTGIVIERIGSGIFINSTGGGGGSSTIYGPDESIQFRNGSILSGATELRWEKDTSVLQVGGKGNFSSFILNSDGSSPSANQVLGISADGLTTQYKTITSSGQAIRVYNDGNNNIVVGALSRKSQHYGYTQTTDATTTTIVAMTSFEATSASSTHFVEADIVACSSTTGAAYRILGAFRSNNGSVMSQIGSTDKTAIESLVFPWDVEFAVSANTILVRVIGQAATNIKWRAATEKLEVYDDSTS